MQLRFLNTGFRSAAENMGIDQAVLEEIAAGKSLPTLRFYGWTPAAISIGYFQSLEEEVNLAACQNLGVQFVRRITGGGAVLHEHEITYSIHIPESSKLVPAGILESYGKICDGILKGLAHLGLSAKFVPLNDIVLEKDGVFKKISGNAQTRRNGVILQHGTILLKVDVEKMFSILKVPNEKLKGKLIEDVKQRVTGLSHVLGRDVGFDEASNVLKKGFTEAFPDVQFEEGSLSAAEEKSAKQYALEKYSADAWNKKR